MKILIFGLPGSGKTTLAKPFAELINGEYIKCGKLYTIQEHLDNNKIVVIDKRCEKKKIKKLDPDFIVWMDMLEEKLKSP